MVIFYTPWTPPFFAVQALSKMFPGNMFLLNDGGDGLPVGKTLFHAGKSSLSFLVRNFNSDSGKSATLYEIFLSVLNRSNGVTEALAEVNKVKNGWLAEFEEKKNREWEARDDSDPTLNLVGAAIVAPYTYDLSMMKADEEQIAEHIAREGLQPAQGASSESNSE
jgi:hypothetical protein